MQPFLGMPDTERRLLLISQLAIIQIKPYINIIKGFVHAQLL